MNTTAPSGTAIRTGSGRLPSLLSSNIGMGVRLVELEVVGSVGKMADRTSIDEESEDDVTVCTMDRAWVKVGVGVGVGTGVNELGNSIDVLSSVEVVEMTL